MIEFITAIQRLHTNVVCKRTHCIIIFQQIFSTCETEFIRHFQFDHSQWFNWFIHLFIAIFSFTEQGIVLLTVCWIRLKLFPWELYACSNRILSSMLHSSGIQVIINSYLSSLTRLDCSIHYTRFIMLQWNHNQTKGKGTGEICSL